MKDIYLDYNATTPVRAEVVKRMAGVMAAPYNASSVHYRGREAAEILEKSRQQVAEAVGAHHARVIFTASGTEANNLAAQGLPTSPLAVSAIEHLSMLQAEEHAARLPVTHKGVIDLEALEHWLKGQQAPALVSVMLANNETGIIQPVKQVVEIVHRYDGMVHTDASQAVGKIAVDMADLGVDMMTLSAHKFRGPQGAAALVISRCVQLSPQLKGGGQELGIRAGTHNLAAIAGMAEAALYIKENIAAMERVKTLRDGMESRLKAYAPKAVIIGQEEMRLPNTASVAMPGVGSETQLIHFDLQRIAVSAGSACSSGKVGKSHVLQAMGLPEEIAGCAIRVSLGTGTTEEEVVRFAEVWKELYDRAGKT